MEVRAPVVDYHERTVGRGVIAGP